MVDARRLQSFADRILSLKADEDEIKKEIRGVYEEALEADVDKTGLGQLVTYLRKRGKNVGDFDAKEAIFLGYLELYNASLTRTHAYARARDGEIKDNPGGENANSVEKAGASHFPLSNSQHGAESAEEETQVANSRASSSANSSTAARKDVPGPLRMTPASDPQPEPQDRIGGSGNDPEVVILAAGTQAPPVETHTPPAEGNTPTSAGHGDRRADISPAATVVADNVVPIKKRWTFNDPAHRDCLDPTMCGGFSNLKLCQRCREASEGGQVA